MLNRLFFNVFGAKVQELRQLFECQGIAETVAEVKEGYTLPPEAQQHQGALDQPGQQQVEPEAPTPTEPETEESGKWYALPLAVPNADRGPGGRATATPNTVTMEKNKAH